MCEMSAVLFFRDKANGLLSFTTTQLCYLVSPSQRNSSSCKDTVLVRPLYPTGVGVFLCFPPPWRRSCASPPLCLPPFPSPRLTRSGDEGSGRAFLSFANQDAGPLHSPSMSRMCHSPGSGCHLSTVQKVAPSSYGRFSKWTGEKGIYGVTTGFFRGRLCHHPAATRHSWKEKGKVVAKLASEKNESGGGV